jgi:formylglycine-generating enzyme required for sulfatase activity
VLKSFGTIWNNRITSAVTLLFLITCVSLSMNGCEKREDTPQYTPPAAMPGEKIQVFAAVAAKSAFRDCENCPQMVAIPAGEFAMGSPPGEVSFVANQGPPIKNAADLSGFLKFTAEREQPQHRVVIAKPFAVSQFVITSRQYDEFFREWKELRIRSPFGCKFYPMHDDLRAGADYPAYCVDWPDAVAYVQWLSTKTGRKYRLLSEAEWEYVARAGTATPFYWGSRNDLACQYANAADLNLKKGMPLLDANTCDNGISFDLAVGRFKPNAFGLYDIVGNLKQWVQDCDNHDYTNAPANGSARMTGNCEKHIVRGGYWRSHPLHLRSASRTAQSSTDPGDMTIRVAAELDKEVGQFEQTSTTDIPVHQSARLQSPAVGETFRDCPDCPEMVVLPSGQFEMEGEEHPAVNAGNSNALARRIVTIAKPFAMGKFLVTQHEWFLLMGTLHSGDPSCHNCPVADLTWFDAQNWVRKLGQQTGNIYRLPSEAEWEYACRAGVRQTYCGGDDLDRVAWYSRNSDHWTHPVGQKAPNAWGLFDMTGNVDQWLEDCNHYFFDKTPAPTDGSAWTTGDCLTREYRGGNFAGYPEDMRATRRHDVNPAAMWAGFRVVREIAPGKVKSRAR